MKILPRFNEAMHDLSAQSFWATLIYTSLYLPFTPLMSPAVGLSLICPLVACVLFCVISAILFYASAALLCLCEGIAEMRSEWRAGRGGRHCPALLAAAGWHPTTQHADGGWIWLLIALASIGLIVVLSLLAMGVVQLPTRNKRRSRDDT